MRSGRGGSLIVIALGLVALVPACTGERADLPSTSAPTGSITFARYFFSASGIRGVLEVDSSPPSICYSTQSSPARPIDIIPGPVFVSGPSPGVSADAEVSYAPRDNDFCDRTVSPDLAAALIADPSAFHVRWRPIPGGPTASSSFTSV